MRVRQWSGSPGARGVMIFGRRGLPGLSGVVSEESILRRIHMVEGVGERCLRRTSHMDDYKSKPDRKHNDLIVHYGTDTFSQELKTVFQKPFMSRIFPGTFVYPEESDLICRYPFLMSSRLDTTVPLFWSKKMRMGDPYGGHNIPDMESGFPEHFR